MKDLLVTDDYNPNTGNGKQQATIWKSVMGLNEILRNSALQMIGDSRGSMPDITGTGTSQKVKKIFGFIWKTGRHILEMMPGTSIALAMCFCVSER